MSPLIRPLSTTLCASTEPSTTPCSLMDSDAGKPAVARTLPLMRPSTCNPPANSTSPCTLALRPISVSIWPSSSFSCRLNMQTPEALAQSGGPDESAAIGCDALACRSNLNGHAIRLEVRRQRERLLNGLVIAKIERHLLPTPRELRQIDAGRIASLSALHGDPERAV